MAQTTFFRVFQMSLLEMEETGESTPQGVALLLVGSDPECAKEQEFTRNLRMYNLASLISLAKWAISPKVCCTTLLKVSNIKGAMKCVKPLNIHRPPNWHPHRSTKKNRQHKQSGSLAKSLRSLMTDSSQDHEPPPPASYPEMLQASLGSSTRTAESRPHLSRSSTLDSWDVVEDLPLRWATDYVPLAGPGSRLMNSPVSTYALWRSDEQSRSSALLAVAVKSAVLLYESPKGERAFRFVKVSCLFYARKGIQSTLKNTPRNSTHRSRLVASRSSVRACRTILPGVLQRQVDSCALRLSTYEPRVVACGSARHRSCQQYSTRN
jgi:hypothetical protein